MADSAHNGSGNDAAGSGEPPREVLSRLPRTRPQHASARRSSARAARAPGQASKPAAKPAAKRAKRAAPSSASAAAAGKPKPVARKRAASAGHSAPAPRRAPATAPAPRARAARSPEQGFEAVSGRSVDPPSGAEVLSGALGAAGELAHATASLGERLLRGALSRLPKP